MDDIKIRYNTDRDKINPDLLPWRVLINNVEFLASHVELRVYSTTSEDLLSSGVIKWHIACKGRAVWENSKCIITE